MLQFIQILVVSIIVVVLAGWWWRRWRRVQLKARRELAMLEFTEQRRQLQDRFLAAASATGKPRGLRWKQCDLLAGEIFASDRVSGELYALVGTTVSFEAIPGGDMEDVEAVGNLRSATAVFAHHRGAWTTQGRVVFNLEPHEALEHFSESLLLVEQASGE